MIRTQDSTRNALWTALFLSTLLLGTGCPSGDDKDVASDSHDLVGKMSDTSYFNARGNVRVNGNHDEIQFEDWEGSYLWADYAAPWCAPCKGQAKVIASLEGSMDDVIFVTVMTSEMGGYGHPATPDTAARWASQNGLDADHTIAANLTSLTIPRHILYSPEGHMLFLKTGTMSAGEIRGVIAARKSDYEAWKSSGSLADWMKR
ncbi:MAG: TlpA family protein disulfide reductase [Planctomycetota bacterium]|jgi:thiol-disulfide isomerase/thioredoxin